MKQPGDEEGEVLGKPSEKATGGAASVGEPLPIYSHWIQKMKSIISSQIML